MDRQTGLTLIELMVTLAVAIVLLAVGIPAFNSLTARDISTSTVNNLVGALQQARVEALSRGETVAVCPLAAATPCNPNAAPACAAADWRCGWAVVRTSTAETLRVFPEPRKQIAIALSGIGGASPKPVRFTNRGELPPEPQTTGDATLTVDVFPSVDHGDPAAIIRRVAVSVNRVGLIRSEVTQ